MKASKVYKVLLATQGIYTFITALWGIINIDSFMAVTGPKNDIWLVKTVSVVLLAVASCLISFIFIKTHLLPAIILGLTTAAGLSFIDFYYHFSNIISWVYFNRRSNRNFIFIFMAIYNYKNKSH